MFVADPKKKPIQNFDVKIFIRQYVEIQSNKKFIKVISTKLNDLLNVHPKNKKIKFNLDERELNDNAVYLLTNILQNIPVPINSDNINNLEAIAQKFQINSLTKEIKTYKENDFENCKINYKDLVPLVELSEIEQKLIEISEDTVGILKNDISFYLSDDDTSSTESISTNGHLCQKHNTNVYQKGKMKNESDEDGGEYEEEEKLKEYNDEYSTTLIAYLILQVCFARPEKIDLYLTLLSKCDNAIQDDFKEIFLNHEFRFKKKNTYYYIVVQCFEKNMLFKLSDFEEEKYVNNSSLYPFFHKKSKGSLDTISSMINGKNQEEIAITLRNDDLDNLMRLFDNDPDFNVNGTIIINQYERNQFLSEIGKVSFLKYACFFGSHKCFDFLQINGAKMTDDIVDFAIIGGNVDLIHKCEAQNLSFKSVIQYSIEYHHSDVFEWLFETKHVQQTDINHLIKKCFENGCYTILLNLHQEEGEDLMIGIYDLSFILAKYFCISSLKKIIFNEDNNKLDIFSYSSKNKGDTIVHILIKKGYFDLVKQILTNYKFNMNYKGKLEKTILHLSLIDGRLDLVKMILLNDKVNINQQDFFGFSALHYATHFKQVEAMKILLNQKNIDINIKTFKNYYISKFIANQRSKISLVNDYLISYNKAAPLHIATMNEFVEGAKLLIMHPKIDINAVNGATDAFGKSRTHKTAIMLACQNGCIKIVDLILKRKDVNLDFFSYEGKTALYYAVGHNHEKIVRKIITYNQKSENPSKALNLLVMGRGRRFVNKSPLDIARERKYDRIVSLLEKYETVSINGYKKNY